RPGPRSATLSVTRLRTTSAIRAPSDCWSALRRYIPQLSSGWRSGRRSSRSAPNDKGRPFEAGPSSSAGGVDLRLGQRNHLDLDTAVERLVHAVAGLHPKLRLAEALPANAAAGDAAADQIIGHRA